MSGASAARSSRVVFFHEASVFAHEHARVTERARQREHVEEFDDVGAYGGGLRAVVNPVGED